MRAQSDVAGLFPGSIIVFNPREIVTLRKGCPPIELPAPMGRWLQADPSVAPWKSSS